VSVLPPEASLNLHFYYLILRTYSTSHDTFTDMASVKPAVQILTPEI